jgi:hypothetical protein
MAVKIRPSLAMFLLPMERFAVSVRQHPASLIAICALTLAGLLGAVVFGALAAHGSSDFVLTVWIAWSLLLLRMIFRVFRWAVDYFVVTSDRMLIFTGLLTRTVSMIALEEVNDLSIRRSFGGRLLEYGDLEVQFGSPERAVQRIQFLPHPEKLYSLISEAMAPPGSHVCGMCDGAGNVYRRAGGQASLQSDSMDYRAFGERRRNLPRQGSLEVACPTCGGSGTLPGSGRSVEHENGPLGLE